MSNAPNWKDNVAALPPSEIALSERLQNAKSERARLADEREAREKARELREQVEAEELALRDEQAIEAAIAEHGEIGVKLAVMHTPLGAVIIKKPHHVMFKRFQDQSLGELKVANCEALIRSCLVHPDKAAFGVLAEELPGILIPLANLASSLCGVRAAEAQGK